MVEALDGILKKEKKYRLLYTEQLIKWLNKK